MNAGAPPNLNGELTGLEASVEVILVDCAPNKLANGFLGPEGSSSETSLLAGFSCRCWSAGFATAPNKFAGGADDVTLDF